MSIQPDRTTSPRTTTFGRSNPAANGVKRHVKPACKATVEPQHLLSEGTAYGFKKGAACAARNDDETRIHQEDTPPTRLAMPRYTHAAAPLRACKCLRPMVRRTRKREQDELLGTLMYSS